MDAIYVVSDQGSIKEEQWWAALFLVGILAIVLLGRCLREVLIVLSEMMLM